MPGQCLSDQRQRTHVNFFRVPLTWSGELQPAIAPERRDTSRSFVDVLKSGGPVMIPLLIVGLIVVLLTLERATTLPVKSGASVSPPPSPT